MPATSQEPSGRFAFRSEFQAGGSVDERGCRRDIRSNGWTVISAGFALTKPVRQKKLNFVIDWRSSFGADPEVRSFSGGFRRLRFGPDVFADALVPLPARIRRPRRD
jgi:hypothetical protein